MKRKTKHFKNEDQNVVRENFLTQDELFLISYLDGFDRKKLKKWDEKGLWRR